VLPSTQPPFPTATLRALAHQLALRHVAARRSRACPLAHTTTTAAAAAASAAAALGVAHDTNADLLQAGAAAVQPLPSQRVAVLFTGDRVLDDDAPFCTSPLLASVEEEDDAALVRRLARPAAAARAMARRLDGAAATRVLAVAPARYTRDGLAVYDGWLSSLRIDASTGEPPGAYRAEPRAPAWHRLAATLRAAGVARDAPLLLCGHSKGAVVVNALLAELAATPPPWAEAASGETEAEEVAARVRALRAVHLLDAGAQRRGVAHITQPPALLAALAAALRALRALRGAPVRVHMHGTPRQWHDTRRPWLAREAETFARCVDALFATALSDSPTLAHITH
jgi:hypothetical protein